MRESNKFRFLFPANFQLNLLTSNELRSLFYQHEKAIRTPNHNRYHGDKMIEKVDR
jgi:hypothetical protein